MLVGSLTKDKLQANLVKAGLCAGGEEEEQHLVWGLKISPKKMQKQWIFSFLFLSWIKYYFFTVMAECVDVLFINAVQKKTNSMKDGSSECLRSKTTTWIVQQNTLCSSC